MRICLICVEIFAWGKYGGFGRATRLIGRELAKRGHEVFAVVPRRPGQRPVERLDGITVLGFSPWVPWTATRLLRQADADIYHSCEPSLGTYLALRALPDRRHLVTFRDPRNWRDWLLEYARPSLHQAQVIHNFLYESNILVRRSIRRMDGVFATARYLRPKIRAMYRLPQDPSFLPTPVDVPARVAKAAAPTVCYLARLDRRKRPELFLALARQFPHVRFRLVGRSRDVRWEARLRRQAAGLANLDWVGFVDQFRDPRHSAILSESWIMVNTATREALPNAFLEAAAHGCAILSRVDADGFASQFGAHVPDDDFARGLRFLLEGARWRALGERGRHHVAEVFELHRAIDQHARAYEVLLTQPSARRFNKRPGIEQATCRGIAAS